MEAPFKLHQVVDFGRVPAGLSNLTSGLLNLYGSVILAFPLNVRFFSTGPFVVYFDEDGADQTFE